MISKQFKNALIRSVVATTIIASNTDAMTYEAEDISIIPLQERAAQLKDGRLNTLGINNFNVICPEGIFSPKDARTAGKKITIELNSVTLPEMAREHRDLTATRIQDPLMTQQLLTGSQSFSLDTNGKLKQLNTMNSIIDLAESWINAGKEPVGIIPDNEKGMKRIVDHARSLCFGAV